MADRAHTLAIVEGAAPATATKLVAALGSLADEAESAALAMASCFPSADGGGAPPGDVTDVTAALTALRAADTSSRILASVVRAAVVVYAEVCGVVADRLAIAEEHAPVSSHSEGHLTAHALATTARALTLEMRAQTGARDENGGWGRIAPAPPGPTGA
jgi:hypothetical protein